MSSENKRPIRVKDNDSAIGIFTNRTEAFLQSASLGSPKILAVSDMSTLLFAQDDLQTGIADIFPFDDGIPYTNTASALAFIESRVQLETIHTTIQRRRTTVAGYKAAEQTSRLLVSTALQNSNPEQDPINIWEIGHALRSAVEWKLDKFGYPSEHDGMPLVEFASTVPDFISQSQQDDPKFLATADLAEQIEAETIVYKIENNANTSDNYRPLTMREAVLITTSALKSVNIKERIREHMLTIPGYRIAFEYLRAVTEDASSLDG